MLNAVSDCEIAARIAVKVVPTFAPMIKGNAFFKEILRVATKETVTEVVRELDCKAAVNKVPQVNARRGVPNTNSCSLYHRSPMSTALSKSVKLLIDINNKATEIGNNNHTFAPAILAKKSAIGYTVISNKPLIPTFVKLLKGFNNWVT